MRFKKVTAAILAAATLAGFTGCNFEDKKNIDAVIKVTDQYVEALSNFDSKGILELTNWDKDDEGYTPKGIEWPGIAFTLVTLPSLLRTYLPIRGPKKMAPIKADIPPTIWIAALPA